MRPNAFSNDSKSTSSSTSTLTMLIPNGSALVSNTSNVCGNILSSTIKSFSYFDYEQIIASAAAVPSSKKMHLQLVIQ